MVKVEIELDNARIFLFPASVALTPTGGDDALAPLDDTTVRGVLAISSDHQARIGPIRVIWEVAKESRKKTETPSWEKRVVLARFEKQVTEDDSWVESGITRLEFAIKVPSLLPPTCETVFHRTSHTLVASVLEPTPEYSIGPVPEYEDHGHSLFPPRSVSSGSHWSFSSAGSRRSSFFAGSTLSRVSSTDTRRTSLSANDVDNECTSRRPSLADSSSRRSSVFASSRRSSAESQEGEQEKTKKKGGIFGGFRRKSSAASTGSRVGEALVDDAKTSCAGAELDESLLPSLASHRRALEIVSCPAPQGEICTVDWFKNARTPGLGHVEKYVHSDILSLGSAVNFEYKATEIPANSTIHNVRLLLCQTTQAANGESEEEIFTLFSRGSTGQQHHVWRGAVARTWDAQDLKSIPKSKFSNSSPRPALPQATIPGCIAAPSSLIIRSKARLPTYMVGAVPTSPTLLDNRLARVTHRLRIETIFSVLGEDEFGLPLPIETGAKNGRPAEGVKRRVRVDHPVVIGSCCITPENILVPTYSASPETSLGLVQHQARVQARRDLANFHIPRTSTRAAPLHGSSRQAESSVVASQDVSERLARHAAENDLRCLCFHADATIAEMIGSLEKPAPASDMPILMDIGDMVKSLHVPTIEQLQIQLDAGMLNQPPADATRGPSNHAIASM